MINRLKLFMLTCLIFLSSQSIGQTNDSIEIVKTFDRYKKAIQTRNGVEVYRLLDKNTIEWYSFILEKIKYADSIEVSDLSLNDKMTVLSTRLMISKDSISKFDGRTFCIYVTNNAILGNSSDLSLKLQRVFVSGDKAKAPVVATPEGDIIEFEFNKENGSWKFNLSSVFKAEDLLLKKYLSDENLHENDYALYILEAISDKKPTNVLWNRLFTKSGK